MRAPCPRHSSAIASANAAFGRTNGALPGVRTVLPSSRSAVPSAFILDRDVLVEALGMTRLLFQRLRARSGVLSLSHRLACSSEPSTFRGAGHLLGADRRARVRLRPAGELLVVLAQQIERLVVELLEIEEHVARLLRHPDQLVDLDMHGGGVAVLRVLDHEHHQEGDDGGRRVDHELPGVAEAEERPQHRPNDDARERRQGRRAGVR